MNLIHLSTSKDYTGIYSIDVLIDGKPYNYKVASSYHYDEFLKNLRRKKPGTALNILKKINITYRSDNGN